jgi:hypothetical protein
MIEDIVAMPGFMTFWACQFPMQLGHVDCDMINALSHVSR